MNDIKRRPAVVFHPGVYLKDELNARGISIGTFAWMSSMRQRLIHKIIDGEIGITMQNAKKISVALGTSIELWINLDLAYKDWIWEANE